MHKQAGGRYFQAEHHRGREIALVAKKIGHIGFAQTRCGQQILPCKCFRVCLGGGGGSVRLKTLSEKTTMLRNLGLLKPGRLFGGHSPQPSVLVTRLLVS